MSTTEKLQILTLFLEVLIFLLIVRKVLMCAPDASAWEDRLSLEPSKPDLMEQALLNISMRKMQLQLRELLVYGEPDDLKDLMNEYMRLKGEQEEKEPQC